MNKEQRKKRLRAVRETQRKNRAKNKACANFEAIKKYEFEMKGSIKKTKEDKKKIKALKKKARSIARKEQRVPLFPRLFGK